MSKVIPIKNKSYQVDHCAGCKKKIPLDERYHEVKLPYSDYNKHIALCKKCYNIAINHGVDFQIK
ncbi:hypothetical protein [Gracilibacillus thailandensis]|uniref:Uncharacterized protein n=1 Tax=Gracilibacillus thailandensis TaxID=563735 RepID=A0A6N7QZJ8_9BACI|nr:hypothetical protein [Gracilibacillus thailandensis]MRI66140.1 hypothetical protein [Gracilibacillus thailandensis]